VRLQEGEAAEADAVAAVNKLAEEEVEAVRQWASAGAVGPKPVADLDARPRCQRAPRGGLCGQHRN
jgi:hypothetical protein